MWNYCLKFLSKLLKESDLKQGDYYDAEKKMMTANHDDYLMGALLEVALGFHCFQYLIGMKLDFGWNLKERQTEKGDGIKTNGLWLDIDFGENHVFKILWLLRFLRTRLRETLSQTEMQTSSCIHCQLNLHHVETSFIPFEISFAFSRNRKKEEKAFQIKVYKESKEKENNM